ncbi:GCN5 family N-acetyltransferase [Flexivirga endophytica]|uniref:GCN5 family N-acetyltransferase n=1 Tax=Flexivirga endophytica TaxID=1849103 RepID=A0A916WMK2_9MICO|nr:GNAT family N-acetyltransferase [Flexivirga endophytica]GGB16493.1 GCN5 family N-acetyltransferase [Flexivirga endophytica]GHB39057.1 GCN5 family N-acetyltransferase [Flexivirga endophytica]
MTISLPLTPVTLEGRLVRLEPLQHDHHDGLVEAASDGELWDRWYTSVPEPDGMPAEIDRRLALQEAGTMMPFTTIRVSDDAVIGMTTFMDIVPSVPRLEIGSTWNRESVHGTGTNPESKLLMMTHAFETWDVEAVRYRTHKMNLQSRTAIERLGAELEGILRADSMDAYGVVRDTAQYSIVARTWPMVKANLQHRLRHR